MTALPNGTTTVSASGSTVSYTASGAGNVAFKLWAGAGGGGFGASQTTGRGGAGGYVTGTVAVVNGDVLMLQVGTGGKAAVNNTTRSVGGYPDGGSGGVGSNAGYCGGGGGGSTRLYLNGVLIAIAGAGAGGTAVAGGDGGGTSGTQSYSYPGNNLDNSDTSNTPPGTQTAGGQSSGGDTDSHKVDGSSLQGGSSSDGGWAGGGGGGGYYGGGAGTGTSIRSYRGGAGGSGYTKPTTVTSATNQVGSATGPAVTTGAPAGTGVGGSGSTTAPTNGGDGYAVLTMAAAAVGTGAPGTITMSAPVAAAGVAAAVSTALPGPVTLSAPAGYIAVAAAAAGSLPTETMSAPVAAAGVSPTAQGAAFDPITISTIPQADAHGSANGTGDIGTITMDGNIGGQGNVAATINVLLDLIPVMLVAPEAAAHGAVQIGGAGKAVSGFTPITFTAPTFARLAIVVVDVPGMTLTTVDGQAGTGTGTIAFLPKDPISLTPPVATAAGMATTNMLQAFTSFVRLSSNNAQPFSAPPEQVVELPTIETFPPAGMGYPGIDAFGVFDTPITFSPPQASGHGSAIASAALGAEVITPVQAFATAGSNFVANGAASVLPSITFTPPVPLLQLTAHVLSFIPAVRMTAPRAAAGNVPFNVGGPFPDIVISAPEATATGAATATGITEPFVGMTAPEAMVNPITSGSHGVGYTPAVTMAPPQAIAQETSMAAALYLITRNVPTDVGPTGYVDGVLGVIINLDSTTYPSDATRIAEATKALNATKSAAGTGEDLAGANVPGQFPHNYLDTVTLLGTPVGGVLAAANVSLIIQDIEMGGMSTVQTAVS